MAYKETMQHKPSFVKEAVIQIGSGGCAGFVEACIMHPMDLIKTRFQLQVKSAQNDTLYYTGTVSLTYMYFIIIFFFDAYNYFLLIFNT